MYFFLEKYIYVFKILPYSTFSDYITLYLMNVMVNTDEFNTDLLSNYCVLGTKSKALNRKTQSMPSWSFLSRKRDTGNI